MEDVEIVIWDDHGVGDLLQVLMTDAAQRGGELGQNGDAGFRADGRRWRERRRACDLFAPCLSNDLGSCMVGSGLELLKEDFVRDCYTGRKTSRGRKRNRQHQFILPPL